MRTYTPIRLHGHANLARRNTVIDRDALFLPQVMVANGNRNKSSLESSSTKRIPRRTADGDRGLFATSGCDDSPPVAPAIISADDCATGSLHGTRLDAPDFPVGMISPTG